MPADNLSVWGCNCWDTKSNRKDTTPKVITRLELLHLIQDNAELLTLSDAVSLLAGRLGRARNYLKVMQSWDEFTQVLSDSNN
jgi:hypothetical protein